MAKPQWQSAAMSKKPCNPDSWPVIWRMVLVPPDGSESFVIETCHTERDARRRAVEMRRLGWPVHLEKAAQQPLPDRAMKRIQRLAQQRADDSATRH